MSISSSDAHIPFYLAVYLSLTASTICPFALNANANTIVLAGTRVAANPNPAAPALSSSFFTSNLAVSVLIPPAEPLAANPGPAAPGRPAPAIIDARILEIRLNVLEEAAATNTPAVEQSLADFYAGPAAASEATVTWEPTVAPTTHFRFDPATGKCTNEAGEQGFNIGIGPCGDFRGQILAYRKWQGRDLRGSIFGQNQTYGGALYLQKADLRFATFKALLEGHGYSLEGADLRSANLHEVELSHVFSGSVGKSIIVKLAGAKFNASTKLPKLDGIPLTAEEAVSKFKMILQD